MIFAAVCLAAAAYVIGGIILYCIQDSLVFLPSAYPVGKLERHAAKNGFAPWLNDRGERIGWQSIDGDARNVFLAFPGQGGSALDLDFLGEYSMEFGPRWKVFLLEYPGYGGRPGVPSEQALTVAALEGLDLLNPSERRIWLVGQSLGSGVACAVLRERPSVAAGLILLTPFNSFTAAAASQCPIYPVSFLLRTRFDSVRNIAGYHGPVAFFLCQKDSKIPMALARRFYEEFAGPKRLWVEPFKDHDASGILKEEWDPMMTWLLANAREG